MASCISNYELYKLLKRSDPTKSYGFPASTPIYILNVAPTDDQAGIVFDMIQNMAMQCPFMKDRSLHNTMTYFDIQTESDMKQHGKPKASLLSMAGGCSSNSLRGRNAIVVIMDEMAHFIDNSGRFSGSEVYKALTPSIASFHRDGKAICISSPYAKYGAFYDRYTQSREETDITLMFKMYSAMVNPTIPTEILAAARRRDRVGFMCEYGGEFSDSITAWIEDENEFKRCVHAGPAPIQGLPDTKYYMGIDLGFKNDGSAVAIVHQDKASKQIILDYANVWFSGSSDVWEIEKSIYSNCRKYASRELLTMAEIVDEVKALSLLFPVRAGVFDQSNGYGLAELFRKENMKQFEMQHFTDQTNGEVYQVVKMLYAEQLVHLFDHPVLIPEMLSLEGERKAKGNIDVRAPNRKGAHDDISEAYARAVWLCYNNQRDVAPNIATGAGGNIGMAGSISGRPGTIHQESVMEFRIKKMQMHGAHPRGLDGLRRKTTGGMGLMGRRLTTGY
jgi:phage terminase large subunit-like protein